MIFFFTTEMIDTVYVRYVGIVRAHVEQKKELDDYGMIYNKRAAFSTKKSRHKEYS